MHLRLADHGLVFSSRDRGERVREALLLEIDDPTRATVILDFDRVISASYSFVDELVGGLAEGMVPNVPRVINAAPAIAERIEKSARRRDLDVDRILADCLQHA